jgi:hypothetical protein
MENGCGIKGLLEEKSEQLRDKVFLHGGFANAANRKVDTGIGCGDVERARVGL